MPQGSVRLAFGIGFAASLVLGGVSVPAINVMEPQPGWALVVGASLAADIAKVGGMTVAREEAVHRSVSVAALPVFQETPSVARFVRPAILAQRDAPSKTWQPTLPQQEWLRAVMSGSEGDAKRETTKPGTTMVALGVPENASVSVVAKVVEMTSAAGSIAPPAPQVLEAQRAGAGRRCGRGRSGRSARAGAATQAPGRGQVDAADESSGSRGREIFQQRADRDRRAQAVIATRDPERQRRVAATAVPGARRGDVLSRRPSYSG